MSLTTVSVIDAVCFISCVSGIVLEREVANIAALKCAGSEKAFRHFRRTIKESSQIRRRDLAVKLRANL